MNDEEKKADKFARRTIAMQLEETRKAEQARQAYINQMPEWTKKEVIEFEKGGRDERNTRSL